MFYAHMNKVNNMCVIQFKVSWATVSTSTGVDISKTDSLHRKFMDLL